MDPLIVVLRKVRRRLSVQQWLSFNTKGLILSCAASCFWLFVTRLFPVLGNPVPVCLGMVTVGLVVCTVAAFVRKPSLVGAALEADRRLTLRERLTSSYELADAEGPMIEAVHLDAREHLERLQVLKAFPYLVPRSLRWLAAPLLVFGLAYMLLPEFDLLHHREREAEAKARAKATRVSAEKLKSAVQPVRVPSDETAAELAEVATAVERVAESLESQEINQKQALARIANLSEELRKRRESLQTGSSVPKLAADASKLGMTREMANDIQNGKFGDAAEKARQLQNKLKEGTLNKKELGELAKELKQLADALGGKESELGKALAEAARSLNVNNVEAALNAMTTMELSLEDIASVLEQLELTDLILANLSEWQQDLLGPCEFCRMCGVPLEICGIRACSGCCPGKSCFGLCKRCFAGIGGAWMPGEGPIGGGMGRFGTGRGGLVGDLPELDPNLKPTVLPGSLTRGKVLADILQKGAPEQDAESTLEYVTGAFVEVRQEAEQALTKEEIPPGAKEFVRQYFGSLEPEARADLQDSRTSPEQSSAVE